MCARRFKATDLDVDAEYDYDGGLEMYESKEKKGGAEVQRQRDRSRQISDHSRILKAEDACTYCVASGCSGFRGLGGFGRHIRMLKVGAQRLELSVCDSVGALLTLCRKKQR